MRALVDVMTDLSKRPSISPPALVEQGYDGDNTMVNINCAVSHNTGNDNINNSNNNINGLINNKDEKMRQSVIT
ncbi:unnamed protein product, partial [Trichobilharzia regenti]